MSKKILVSLLVLLLLGGGVWFFFSRSKEVFIDRPQAGTTIVAFGDSLIEGQGATLGNDMVSLLSRGIGKPIINAGKGGDTTQTALTRLEEDVLSQDPRIVIILLGGNDALQQLPVEQSFKNLGTMTDRIHQKGAAVLLVGIQGGILKDQYKNEFERLAKEKQVSFVSHILKDIFGNSKLMADEIHPNDQGYALMADRILPTLRQMLE